MSPAQFWRTPFGSRPWTPLAGDADGDRRADLLACGHSGDSVIEIARTSAIGKAIDSHNARPSSGKGLIATAAGPFCRANAADVAMVFADGSIKVAWGMAAAKTYTNLDDAGSIPEELRLAAARAAAADFDGDERCDILLYGGEGQLLLLLHRIGPNGKTRFAPVPVTGTMPGMRRIAAGTLGAEKRARFVWQDAGGSVSSALFNIKADRTTLGETTPIATGSPDDPIAVGRFRGEKGADILVGQRLFPSGNPKSPVVLSDLPQTAVAKHDTDWVVADIDGNGKDDLIRHRNAPDRFGGGDVYIHFSYDTSEPTKGYLCTANDGLPDAWKLGLIKPDGLDLKALGCKVGKREVIVEIERFDDFDIARLKQEMDRVVRFFANLPIHNPDGSTGIAMHVIYREPWPAKDRDDVMAHFNDHFPRPSRRGIVHAMMAQNDGPLNAAINGDRGMFNGRWREFLHEFGHQVALVHDAYYPSQSPGFSFDVGSAIYPSLMSYSYSYGLNGNGEGMTYSDGARASFVIDERHLTERLPFPFETVKFLGNGPYYFRIKPGDDGKTTLIDWNWNGLLGEEWVSADTNYTHGTDFGPHYTIAKSKTAPVAVAHGDGDSARPILIFGDPSHLSAKVWLGRNRDTEGGKWSTETVDFQAGMTGNASAVYLGDGVSWVAYPTAKGVVLRKLTLTDTFRAEFGEPTVLPRTVGVQPTLVALNGGLGLLMWRAPNLPLEMSILRPKGSGLTMGAERPLDIKSEAPVGATSGPANKLWIARNEADNRIELLRYSIDAGGGTQEEARGYVDGRYARQRISLLWRSEKGDLPDGRIYLLGGGMGPAENRKDQWITMNVPYKELGGGWYLRRYRQPDFGSAFAPGVCFFEGDIFYAIRGDNEDVHVAFYGSGAGPAPLGDFDDLGMIRDYGLSRSIRGLPR